MCLLNAALKFALSFLIIFTLRGKTIKMMHGPINIRFGNSGSETLQLLRTAYGEAVLSSAQVFRWHKAFKDGRESVEDEQRAGRPSTARTENNVARVKVVLDRDRRLQVRLIAEELGLPKTDIQ